MELLLYLSFFAILHILQSSIMVINNATGKQCNMQYSNHQIRRGTKYTRIFYMGIHTDCEGDTKYPRGMQYMLGYFTWGYNILGDTKYPVTAD